MRPAIAYYRVSTDRQGKSGLGLDAQQVAVKRLAETQGLNVMGSFTEIESGRYSKKRPQLEEALRQCRKMKATIIIAKLDRLARSNAFVSALIQAGIDIKAADNPHANKAMLQMLSVFAELESDLIRARVKEALTAAKKRGVELGKHGKILAVKNRQEAEAFALTMHPILQELEQAGFNTISAKAQELNRRQIPGKRGGRWHKCSVHALLKRLKVISGAI